MENEVQEPDSQIQEPDAPDNVDEQKGKKHVPNKKGRVASVLSLFFWGILISFIFIKGDFSVYPLLMLALFLLLEILTIVRIVQEYKENGEWLEQGEAPQ